MTFDPQNLAPPGAKIKVIGVGGGGGNAINTMIRSGLEGVDFVTCNSDVQALRFSLAPAKIQIGKELTRGLGAGADPDVGRDAALEDRHEIQEMLTAADMVFITAGMGGGTGTGGASVVAQIARELGALTVAVVTKPFQFEGNRRRRHAEAGIARLRECVDTLITIPNQRLLQVASPGLSMIDAFKMADEVLVNAVRGISDIINIPGTVNVDFADVKTVMSCMGQALMGIGHGTGDSRAVDAARMAISSPLLEDIDIEGATGILINITAGANVTLMEVNEACSIIQEAAHEDANIIFGAVIDETLGDQIRVTVIATGFPVDDERGRSEAQSAASIKQSQPLITSRLTTPALTSHKAVVHRPPSQHLTSYAPKRPEPTRPSGPDAYAFTGHSQPTPQAPAPAPVYHSAPPQQPAPQQNYQPAQPAQPTQSAPAPVATEPKAFFEHAAEIAPAAPQFEPQVNVESEAQDLARLTMSGFGSGFAMAPLGAESQFNSEFNDDVEAVEPSGAPIESLAHPLVAEPAPEIPEVMDVTLVAAPPEVLAAPTPEFQPVQEPSAMMGADEDFASTEELVFTAEADEPDFFTAAAEGVEEPQDDILLSEPVAPRTVILPNEPEIVIKAAAPEPRESRIEGATAAQPVADTLFDELDDLLAGGPDSGLASRDSSAAPLDSFFSSDTAAIAGDIDRKINEALELAERMKNPADAKGSKAAPADELDVPAFLRNGLKDLPLG